MQYQTVSSAMKLSTSAPTPESFPIWTLICEMIHDSFKWHISFSSFIVLNLAQDQRSVPNAHSQTEQSLGASHLRCTPGYRHNEITVLIIGNPNSTRILCPESSLKFGHTQPRIPFDFTPSFTLNTQFRSTTNTSDSLSIHLSKIHDGMRSKCATRSLLGLVDPFGTARHLSATWRHDTAVTIVAMPS